MSSMIRPYTDAPFIVIWEVTRACDLACVHCRAEADPHRDPDELTPAEGRALLAHIRQEFGDPVVVFTGGDPLKRSDLLDLIRYGVELGLRIALTPSVTPLLTEQALSELRAAGLTRLALSLDGLDAATHDGFRQVPGTWTRTLAMLRCARDLGMETQINTSVWRGNRHQLADLAALAEDLGVSLWSVFLLVPTGRADRALLMDADEHESVYQELATLAARPGRPLAIKTTAGQPFYRALAQHGQRRSAGGLRSRAPVNDGNGFVFISHIGQICPSGFLPLVCGNVRRDALATVYRTHPLFTALRDPDRLGGKCGACEFRHLCGGSRSRAYALTGDPLAADPTCAYQPRQLSGASRSSSTASAV